MWLAGAAARDLARVKSAPSAPEVALEGFDCCGKRIPASASDGHWRGEWKGSRPARNTGSDMPTPRGPFGLRSPFDGRVGFSSRLGLGLAWAGQLRLPFGGLLRPAPGGVELDDLLAGLGHAVAVRRW